MTNESFLPPSYEKPVGNSNYFKPQEGQNKVRIMSPAITGWLYWTTDSKPVRSKEEFTETPNIKVDKEGKSRINHFWAFVIWDYKDEKLKVYEVTQASIQNAVYSLHNSEWGNPADYDLLINRIGKDINTEYTVMPSPKALMPDNILKEYEEAGINLEALYTGDDPFNAVDEQPSPPVNADEAMPNF